MKIGKILNIPYLRQTQIIIDENQNIYDLACANSIKLSQPYLKLYLCSWTEKGYKVERRF